MKSTSWIENVNWWKVAVATLVVVLGAITIGVILVWPTPEVDVGPPISQYTVTRTCDFLDASDVEGPLLVICDDGTIWIATQQEIPEGESPLEAE